MGPFDSMVINDMQGPGEGFTFDYSGLQSVSVGRDAVGTLTSLVRQRQSRRVFVLASASLRRQSDQLRQLETCLGDCLAGVFSGIRAHTPREDLLLAIAAARTAGTDLLVSVGGGSVIDATKAVQLALELGLADETALLECAQFADGSRGPRQEEISRSPRQPRLAHIAIPTTLSGAEHSCNAGVTDTARRLKEGYRAPFLYPRHIIYDAALTRFTPEWLWLSTAIRSLDHAIEGYCSADSTPFLDGHFLHAMRLFSQSLPRVQLQPQDLAARGLNQQATWLACCGLGRVAHGASHGIGYLLGAVCGVPHGITSCIMLPAVLRWNSPVNGPRQADIAAALGMAGESAAEAVAALVSRLQLPATLRDAGVAESNLEAIAALAARHPVVRRNPRPLTEPAQVMEILRLAW